MPWKVAISGSHKGAWPLPLPSDGAGMEMDCVEHIPMEAGNPHEYLSGICAPLRCKCSEDLRHVSCGKGDVLFFLGGACVHGAAAWRGKEDRRNVIHKYSPSHKGLVQGHFLVPTFTPKM